MLPHDCIVWQVSNRAAAGGNIVFTGSANKNVGKRIFRRRWFARKNVASKNRSKKKAEIN